MAALRPSPAVRRLLASKPGRVDVAAFNSSI
jgi:FXSXX-COOH protein